MGEVRTDTVATSEDAERDPSVQVNLSVHQRGTSALMNGLGRPGPPPGRYDFTASCDSTVNNPQELPSFSSAVRGLSSLLHGSTMDPGR